jgi:hypothetical protein
MWVPAGLPADRANGGIAHEAEANLDVRPQDRGCRSAPNRRFVPQEVLGHLRPLRSRRGALRKQVARPVPGHGTVRGTVRRELVSNENEALHRERHFVHCSGDFRGQFRSPTAIGRPELPRPRNARPAGPAASSRRAHPQASGPAHHLAPFTNKRRNEGISKSPCWPKLV